MYAFCLELNAKYSMLDEIGEHFIDRAAELAKTGNKFVFVLDNIDWTERVHVWQDSQNKKCACCGHQYCI